MTTETTNVFWAAFREGLGAAFRCPWVYAIARSATSRAHTLLRNVAVELEEGRDPVWVADNIHEALGGGRPNGTGEDDEA